MRVGIIGAGISGLSTHYFLQRRGIESQVFEADSEPGGVIDSRERAATILEYGPQRLRLAPIVESILADLGLIDDLIYGRSDLPVLVLRDGSLRVVPTTVTEAVTTDLITWRGKLRALGEPFREPPRPGESLTEAISRLLGPEVATYLAGPLYAGLYASDPASMPVEYSLKPAMEAHGIEQVLVGILKASLRSPPPIVTLAGGLQRLPDALYDRYKDSITLETPIRSLQEANAGVILESDRHEYEFDRVVITTPAPVTASLLESMAPTTAVRFRDLQYNPLAIVHLNTAGPLGATGFHIPFEQEGTRTLGVTATGSLFEERSGVTCYLGGAKAPDVVTWDPDRIGEVAREEFTAITGIDAAVRDIHRLPAAMPARDESWAALEELSLPPGVIECSNITGRPGIIGRIQEGKAIAHQLG